MKLKTKWMIILNTKTKKTNQKTVKILGLTVMEPTEGKRNR